MMIDIILEHFYPSSVLFILSMLGVILGIVALTTYKTLGSPITGFKPWILSMFLFALALTLYILRGSIPDILSMVLANILVLIAVSLISIAYCKFFGTEVSTNYLLAAIFIGSITAIISYIFSLPVSVGIGGVSLAGIIISMTMFIPLFQNRKKNKLLWLPIFSIGLASILLALRIFVVLFGNPNSIHIMSPSIIQLSFYIALALSILSTALGFMIMIHEYQKGEWLSYATIDKKSGLPTKNNYR